MSDLFDERPLPWRISRPPTGSRVVDANGRLVYWQGGIPDDVFEAGVTCFNACAGIANPEAIPELIEAVRRLRPRLKYMSEGAARDTLVALAKLEGNDE